MSYLSRIRRCLAILLLLIVVLAGCGAPAVTFGTELDGRAAPDFALTDQNGQMVALSDFRGKAVALTFIYTSCPDICLLTAQNFRQAYELLPAQTRDKVALVAITVDPDNDSPERLSAFSREQGLDDVPVWFALSGERDELQDVWASYGIDPGTMLLRSIQFWQSPASPVASETVSPGNAALLEHTDAVYLIDPDGKERAFGRSDEDPEALANSLAALAR
jgi:protein SCO1/2